MTINAGQNLIALLPTSDHATGEVFNLHEKGEVALGQFRRYLKIIGPKLDEMKGLIDAFFTMIDVDQTDADFLPFIGALVGVKFNREIPIPQAREEIKQAVAWYKRKGTLLGSRIHGYKISRLQTDIVEFWRNIKTGNREYSFSGKNYGPLTYKLPKDKTSFSYDFAEKSVLSKDMAFASSEEENYESWRAVDGKEASSWRSLVTPAWLAFSFSAPILPLSFRMKAGPGVAKFRLQWADDADGPWEDAEEYTFGDLVEYTQYLGEASGAAQTLVSLRVPIAISPESRVFEVVSYGAVDTVAAVEIKEGDDFISVNDASGLVADDWIEIFSSLTGYGYYQIKEVEGNYLKIKTKIGEKKGFPVLSRVKKVDVEEKINGADFTVNYWEGLVSLLPGRFTAGNKVIIWHFALSDKKSLLKWQSFSVNVENLSPHKYWRFHIDNTWRGNPEIFEVEMFPEQFFGSYYRCERLGYFFTLGNSRPGCRGQAICNLPLISDTVQKLCNTMREAVPIFSIPVMTFLDCHYPENWNVNLLAADAKKDELYTKNKEFYDFYEEQWKDIITTRLLISTYNPTPWIPNPDTKFAERGTYPKVNADGLTWISLWLHA